MFSPHYACGREKDAHKFGKRHIPTVAEEPAVFEEHAVSAGGTFTVTGTLKTEGPLADILCADDKGLNKSKALFTGTIRKALPVKTKNGTPYAAAPSYDNAYVFNDDGIVTEISEGVSGQISPGKSGLGVLELCGGLLDV